MAGVFGFVDFELFEVSFEQMKFLENLMIFGVLTDFSLGSIY